MNQMPTNTTTELAKDYISKRKIPQLFEVRIEREENSWKFLFFSSLGFDYRFDGS